MTEVSFKSRIVPVTHKEFGEIAARIGRKNSIDYPWTLKESILAQDVYTKGIRDCTGCFITDGTKVLGMHLCPTTSRDNRSEIAIVELIKNNIDLKKQNLQAIMIGSNNSLRSRVVYDNLRTILKEKFGIPISELKFSKTPVDVAYRQSSDEFYVANKAIELALKHHKSPTEAVEQGFSKVSIAKCDEII